MQVELREHTVPKQTQWGTVQRSLNQHIVMIRNAETDKWMQCGYVGTTAFLPLAGFPNELVPDVARLCGEHLGRDVGYASAPPTMAEAQRMVDAAQGNTQDDEGDE